MTEFETKVLQKLDALIGLTACGVGCQLDDQFARGQITRARAEEMAGDIEKIMFKAMDDWSEEKKKED